MLDLLFQAAEGLVCVSALYVEWSLSSVAAYAAASGTSSSDPLPGPLLSPHWLLIYLGYNAVDMLYMQFVGFALRFDPAPRYTYQEHHKCLVSRLFPLYITQSISADLPIILPRVEACCMAFHEKQASISATDIQFVLKRAWEKFGNHIVGSN